MTVDTTTVNLPDQLQNDAGRSVQPFPAAPLTLAPGLPSALILDPGQVADPVARERAFAQLLRYQAQVLTGRLGLEEGDRVELLEPVHATWIDEDLAAEEYWEEDARVTTDVSAGTLGVITRIRRYPTPWPYVVAFDRGPECGVRDLQITRCADHSLTSAKPPTPSPEPWMR